MGDHRIAAAAGRADAEDGSQQLAGDFPQWEPPCIPLSECNPSVGVLRTLARGGRAIVDDVVEWCARPCGERKIREQMLRQGYATWSRAGQEILAMYALEGEPLRVLSKFSPPVSVLHVYSQPRAPEFLSVQESFAREHPWYSVHRLEGVSQFPTLEVPDETADVIGEFIQ